MSNVKLNKKIYLDLMQIRNLNFTKKNYFNDYSVAFNISKKEARNRNPEKTKKMPRN